MTVKHSFNSGDLITALPGMKHLYDTTREKVKLFQRLNLPANYGTNDPHPVVYNGANVCMNEETFIMMKPLLESQEYIQSFEIWKGEKVDFDLDLTRKDSQMPLPGGDIHYWPMLIFPQLVCDYSKAWMSIDTSKVQVEGLPESYILINRTERYQNPYIDYFFLKNYEQHLMFVGLEHEHKLFREQYDLDFPRLEVKDFWWLAKLIAGCKFFIGNQSLCFHLADSMKVKRILEVCWMYPNTFPTGNNGCAFINQGSLELFVEQFFNQTIKNERQES